MPIAYTGSICARRDCVRPRWKDGLCVRCWRLARLFGKDPGMFAFEPLNGWSDARDAVALPWDDLEREAARLGVTSADLLGGDPTA